MYVGAVSMVVLFAVLLTRRSRDDISVAIDSPARGIAALLTGGAVLGVLFGAVISSPLGAPAAGARPSLSVKELGLQLMGPHAAALLIVGVLLTVALLGAVVIAAGDRTDAAERKPEGNP